jgi:hypothetical protein
VAGKRKPPSTVGRLRLATAQLWTVLWSGSGIPTNEELRREGIRMDRHRQMARWLNRSTWTWTAYRKQVGRGEGSSGLRVDGLEPTKI